MTDPTPLGPAAQYVWGAFQNAPTCAEVKLAAALRAAATEFRSEMESSLSNDFVRGVLAAASALEEIAAELEAQ